MFDYLEIKREIKEQYLEDNIPWVIGFSGGKDSTTVLQIIYYSLSELPKENLTKEIHVITNDTLVENPAIAEFVDKQLEKIENAGKTKLFGHNPELFNVVKVKPILDETFWTCLIAKGYPSPNRWFRWCTERMKINPTSRYILNSLNGNGKAIIVLGTRKAESGNRARAMKRYDNGDRLRKHTLPNTFVYAPISEAAAKEVWAYLLQARNPWGGNNRELLKLYSNACDGGECPFVIETGSQSCGKSRFGCWVCTVVDRDKSMENFINNGHKWMTKLLEFRNWLYDIRQQSYQYVPQKLQGKARFGPFLLKTRFNILEKLIKMQKDLEVQLITTEEVEFINSFLKLESVGRNGNGMRKYIYELPSEKRIEAVSDFDILQTSRKRLGPLYLKNASLLDSRKMSDNYEKSTRVMYCEGKI